MTPEEKRQIIVQRIIGRMSNKIILMVGDIVAVNPDCATTVYFRNISRQIVGEILVVQPSDMYIGNGIGVFFKRFNVRLHSLGDRCPDGHGWWFPPKALILIKKVEDR